jgi:glutathione S-transferase
MLRIWGRRNSSNVRKVLWTAAVLGIDFELIEAGGAFGGLDTPEFLAMNPNRLVPVIDHDGFVLWESHSIIRYLANEFDEVGALYPSLAQPRAEVDRWLDWLSSTLQPAERAMFFNLIRLPPDQRDLSAIRASEKSTTHLFHMVEAKLASSRFIAGDNFSLADIPLGVMAHRYLAMPEITRPDLPNLNIWFQGLNDRPGFEKYVNTELS